MKKDENLGSLIEIAKSSSSTPIQEIKPLKQLKHQINEEVQIAFYLPKSLYKKVKMVALEKELSIKSILNESIENYIKDIS